MNLRSELRRVSVVQRGKAARLGKTPGASWEKGLESRPFYKPKGALQPYVRLAQFAKTQTQRIAAPRFLVLRPADLRAGAKAALREQPGLCRTRADGAEPGRLPHPRLDGSRQGAGPQRERHRAPVERLPPPAGDPARRPRQRPEHRLPAAPLDLRHEGRALGRPALPRESLPQPRQDSSAELARNAVRGQTRRGEGP